MDDPRKEVRTMLGETRKQRLIWFLTLAAASFMGGWLSQYLPW
jgi:hypothetical protein